MNNYDELTNYIETRLRPEKKLIVWNPQSRLFFVFNDSTAGTFEKFTAPEFYARYGYIIRDSKFYTSVMALILGGTDVV